jgi:hypothetical protein
MIHFVSNITARSNALNAHTVNEDTWAFEIGTTVTHRDQPMPSLVLTRVRAGKLEIYGVRREEECEVRDLMILGEVLVAG